MVAICFVFFFTTFSNFLFSPDWFVNHRNPLVFMEMISDGLLVGIELKP